MVHIPIILIIVIQKIFAGDTSSIAESEPIVSDLLVSPFLDDNGYIRLNISWGEVKNGVEFVTIYFNNSEECSPISDVDNYPLNRHFIIEPGMELEHPADYLIHECLYTITLEEKKVPYKSQSVNFIVPECVENKCRCEHYGDSPNELTNIDSLSEDLFLISWNKSTDENITIQYIYYQRKHDKDKIRTYIPEEKLLYRNNAVEIPIHDLKNGELYTITVLFIDEYNECIYASSLDYMVPLEKQISSFVISSILIILIVLLLYTFSLCSPKLRKKLEKYLSIFPTSYQSYENQTLAIPLTQFKLREEINAQYTPLEFVLKMHKYDEYEFPRNKIIMKDIIGEGAFGKVYYAKAFEIDGNPEFTMVAVKQLREGSPEEEVLNFHSEIETLKKIGRHENIVKLFGCVTMDKPYMMIMELVPCGSLKNYLLNLRKKWTEKKTSRIFFPDDMDELWLKPNNRKSHDGELNYTSCVFDNSECSYIIPAHSFLQTSQTSSTSLKSSMETNINNLNTGRHQFPQKNDNLISSQTPPTPSSTVSSRLPSSTETELTNLDLETPTPVMNEMTQQLEPVLDHTELQLFAFQIANGMAHLEKMAITHRDLAARNILITSEKVLKISDFGMSRTGSYVNQTSKKIPLRWMAIESIEDQKWNSKSDIWSFGVVLWEIGTLGAFPYENTHDVLILPELKKGKRLERPKICTDELYALMLQCWSDNPAQRPSFAELLELLNVKRRKIYVEFSQLSPKYVFPPTRNLNEIVEVVNEG